MRILFQGAGAIGIAGAALFGDRHEVSVASRTPTPRPRPVFPRRVGMLDPRQNRYRNDAAGWTVTGVAATRRVTIIDWTTAQEANVPLRTRGRRRSVWDLIVLTARPGDLDRTVVAAIRECGPRFLAITSQVEGDLDVARSLFPGAEVVIFGPGFLSERTDPSESSSPGSQVRYWAPAGLPRFLIAGRPHAVGELSRSLGGLVMPVPDSMLTMPPAVFIPYVAELSIRDGSWRALRAHLSRPTRAAAEAVRAVTDVRLPMFAPIAGLVLDALERFVPIDIGEYAGRHFARHEGQTLDMLEGWIAAGTGEPSEPKAGRASESAAEPKAGPGSAATGERAPAPALRELAQALRLRVTRQPIP